MKIISVLYNFINKSVIIFSSNPCTIILDYIVDLLSFSGLLF